MKEIKVYRKSDNKLVAGDHGANVTVESLNSKMSIDITDSALYDIVEGTFSDRDAIRGKGRKARLACEAAMEIINGYGQDLTDQQETDLLANHGSALQLLQMNKAWTFKAYIENIDATTDIVISEQMKQDLLAELADHGI